MTIGQPHSHGPGVEEVWTVVSGKNMAFLGKEIRWQFPGTAYKVPPAGTTPHSNINCTEEPIKFLYFSKL
jgi:mannose-6-phosphate isomerase-like protein (cupin superfamily)